MYNSNHYDASAGITQRSSRARDLALTTLPGVAVRTPRAAKHTARAANDTPRSGKGDTVRARAGKDMARARSTTRVPNHTPRATAWISSHTWRATTSCGLAHFSSELALSAPRSLCPIAIGQGHRDGACGVSCGPRRRDGACGFGFNPDTLVASDGACFNPDTPVASDGASGPAAKAGALLMEGDGRNLTNLEVKQFKEITKGPSDLLIKLRAQRGGSVYEAVLERSGGTGAGTPSERGKEGMEAVMTLHRDEELHRLKRLVSQALREFRKSRQTAFILSLSLSLSLSVLYT